MNYATKQLTHALQELTRHEQNGEAQKPIMTSGIISADELSLPAEVESSLLERQTYSKRTRNISVGSY